MSGVVLLVLAAASSRSGSSHDRRSRRRLLTGRSCFIETVPPEVGARVMMRPRRLAAGRRSNGLARRRPLDFSRKVTSLSTVVNRDFAARAATKKAAPRNRAARWKTVRVWRGADSRSGGGLKRGLLLTLSCVSGRCRTALDRRAEEAVVAVRVHRPHRPFAVLKATSSWRRARCRRRPAGRRAVTQIWQPSTIIRPRRSCPRRRWRGWCCPRGPSSDRHRAPLLATMRPQCGRGRCHRGADAGRPAAGMTTMPSPAMFLMVVFVTGQLAPPLRTSSMPRPGCRVIVNDAGPR